MSQEEYLPEFQSVTHFDSEVYIIQILTQGEESELSGGLDTIIEEREYPRESVSVPIKLGNL